MNKTQALKRAKQVIEETGRGSVWPTSRWISLDDNYQLCLYRLDGRRKADLYKVVKNVLRDKTAVPVPQEKVQQTII